MFKNIFNPDHFFFRCCNLVLDLALLSLLWIILCLPVVTAGASTAALYYAVVKCIRRGEPEPYRNFFQCFRENFKAGLPATLVAVGLAAALLTAFHTLRTAAVAGSQGAILLYYAFCVLLLLLIGAAGYLFPLLSRFSLTGGQLLIRACQLALRHLPSTVLLAVLNVFSAWLILQFAFPFVLPLLFGPALAALLASLPLERVFRRYTPVGAAEEGERPWYLK